MTSALLDLFEDVREQMLDAGVMWAQAVYFGLTGPDGRAPGDVIPPPAERVARFVDICLPPAGSLPGSPCVMDILQRDSPDVADLLVRDFLDAFRISPLVRVPAPVQRVIADYSNRLTQQQGVQ